MMTVDAWTSRPFTETAWYQPVDTNIRRPDGDHDITESYVQPSKTSVSMLFKYVAGEVVVIVNMDRPQRRQLLL